ncbi:MAG: beta-N-acetylhexosaminidase [Vulcanimicrobiaceae bacterium]
MPTLEVTDLERLARGTIVVGFDGYELSAEQSEVFRAAGFAGYLLFARNVEHFEQVRMLTDSLRALHEDVAPIVAIDQEGGRVARLRNGAQTIPPMMSLGAAGDHDLAQRAGESIAFDLRRAGCNVDYAPVLDLAVDPMNIVIGTRAFAADPNDVAKLASSVSRGLRAGGIVPTYKHFPGHGSTADDSHLMLPVIELGEATLRARDLLPFLRLLPDAQAVMTAHIVVRAIDPLHPATLSRRILTGILREEFGFAGVCFTDCMQMDAIARGIGTVDGFGAAIAAGADCALVSDDPALALRAADALVRAVARGHLDRARLEQAYRRVRVLRNTLSDPIALASHPPYPGIGRAIAVRAMTAVRGSAHADPATAIVISFQSSTTEGAQGTLDDHPSLQREVPELREVVLPLQPDERRRAQMLESIAASGSRPILLARRAHLYPEQAVAIREVLERHPDAVLVSLREPFDLACFPQARHAIAAYGDDEASIAGLAEVLFKRCDPVGRLPVRLTAT